MFYEKRLGSLADLMNSLGTMDPDAGVRLVGRYSGRDSFLFITKFEGKYTVMVYARKGKEGREAGRFIDAMEFRGIDELRTFIRALEGSKVEAYAY